MFDLRCRLHGIWSNSGWHMLWVAILQWTIADQTSIYSGKTKKYKIHDKWYVHVIVIILILIFHLGYPIHDSSYILASNLFLMPSCIITLSPLSLTIWRHATSRHGIMSLQCASTHDTPSNLVTLTFNLWPSNPPEILSRSILVPIFCLYLRQICC